MCDFLQPFTYSMVDEENKMKINAKIFFLEAIAWNALVFRLFAIFGTTLLVLTWMNCTVK